MDDTNTEEEQPVVGKWVCAKCRGTDIETRAWVDSNSPIFLSDSGDYDSENNWCNTCEEHVEFLWDDSTD